MIDFRHETFLALCKIKSYTKTAQALHMTQPAVSQHVKYLENIYAGKLVQVSKRNFSLTPKGKELFEYTQTMAADARQIEKRLKNFEESTKVSFGATLSIGEFVLPDILNRMMEEDANLCLNMIVENTQKLLERLQKGEISFAFLEGFFDKTKYSSVLFSKEDFIGICSNESSFRVGKYTLEQLFANRLILREAGSGTRDIFEQALFEKNLNIDGFKNVAEMGNMNAIKSLVCANHGITFLYKTTVEKELYNGKLCQIDIEDFVIKREFNFVHLKNSIHGNEYSKWFERFKSHKVQ